jgi:hypothetical protein
MDQLHLPCLCGHGRGNYPNYPQVALRLLALLPGKELNRVANAPLFRNRETPSAVVSSDVSPWFFRCYPIAVVGPPHDERKIDELVCSVTVSH